MRLFLCLRVCVCVYLRVCMHARTNAHTREQTRTHGNARRTNLRGVTALLEVRDRRVVLVLQQRLVRRRLVRHHEVLQKPKTQTHIR